MRYVGQTAGLLLLWMTAQAQLPDAARVAANGIRHESVYNYNRELASERFGGRLTGSGGYNDAANMIGKRFHSWGLRPGNGPLGFYQTFPAPFGLISKASMSVRDSGGRDTAIAFGDGFLPLLYTDSGKWTADAVFVGWGVSAPELGYDDYGLLDVKGKVVFCFRGVPARKDTMMLHYDEHRTRMKIAKERGARGLFYIYENPIANPNGDFIAGFTPAVVSYGIADVVLSGTGWHAAGLRDSLARGGKPIAIPLNVRITYAVESIFNDAGRGVNVLAVKPGTDPKLKNEYVIIGAHLDHCGTHAGLTFPGANDNGSGSAVVEAIAEAFARSKKLPLKRSVMFVLFGGEEMGLKGSNAMAASLPKEIKSVAGMLNFDMVGEGDGAWVGFSASDTLLRTFVQWGDKEVKIVRGISPMEGVVGSGNTDFAPFMKRGISCLNFSSNGPHLSYHQSGDTIYRINPDMLASMAKLGFLTAVAIANR